MLYHGDDEKPKIAEPELIWLPNSLVMGAADEVSPVELLRQTQDVGVLEQFIDFYAAHNLVEDGGVSRSVIFEEYEREKISESGAYVLWGFRLVRKHSYPNAVVETYQKLDDEDRPNIFFGSLQLMEDLGLLTWHPYLVESADRDSEIIHALSPSHEDGLDIEKRIAIASREAVERLLSHVEGRQSGEYTGPHQRGGNYLAAVPRHMANVQVRGIARLRYRPRTARTSAWFADLHTQGEQIIARYESID